MRKQRLLFFNSFSLMGGYVDYIIFNIQRQSIHPTLSKDNSIILVYLIVELNIKIKNWVITFQP